MENESAIATTEQKQEKWTPAQIDAIKKLVAPNATPAEFTAYLSLAAKYDLDPFAHEIWFVNMEGRNTIITGRDGYLTIANRNPHYRGMQSDVVYSEDTFTRDASGGVNHAYKLNKNGNRGQIIGAYAEVYRDDRIKPVYCFAPMSNYNRNNRVWRQYPHSMILKVAEAMALKRAFSISGLVTDAEVDYQASFNLAQPQLSHKEIAKSIWFRFLNNCDGNKEQAMSFIKNLVGDKPSSQWTDEDIKTLNNALDAFDDDDIIDVDTETMHPLSSNSEANVQENSEESDLDNNFDDPLYDIGNSK